VVTYEYHYTIPFREDTVGTHTAVVYRDETNPNNPWWLMEDRLARPIWMSGEDLKGQLEFYVHHEVNVVHEKAFPARGEDHKESLAMARSANGYLHAGASHPGHFHAKPAPNYYEMAAVLPQSAAQKGSFTARFRAVYGRSYNSSSATDRRKMVKLQNASRHRQPLASQTY
jgi:hypothetical protein